MLHFVTSYMKQNKSRKQTLESAQYGLEISFNLHKRVFQRAEIVRAASASAISLFEKLTSAN